MSRQIITFPAENRLPAGFRIEHDTETRRYHWIDPFGESQGYCSAWIARTFAWHEAGRRGYVPEALHVSEIRA